MSTGGLGVLTSNLESPEMSKTSVGLNFFKSFEIFSHLGIKIVGSQLVVLAILEVVKRTDTSALRLVAVQGGRRNAGFFKTLRQGIGTVLGGARLA